MATQTYPVAEANTVLLMPPAPPAPSSDPIVGRYALEIVVSSSQGGRCETVPAHAKRRTYTADIAALGDRYAVLLYDAVFLRDFGNSGYGCSDRRLQMNGVCHQFLMYREDTSSVSVSIISEDEWRGSEIWEVLPSEGRLLQLHGQARGSVRVNGIDASGTGGLWYGNGLPASDVASCGPGDIGLTFTRR